VERVDAWCASNDLVGNAFWAFSTGRARSTGCRASARRRARWLAVTAGSSRAINLDIATRHRFIVRTLSHLVYRRLARSAPSHSPVRDYVFASVMLGRSLEPLSVRAPRLWRELLWPQHLVANRTRRNAAAAVVSLSLVLPIAVPVGLEYAFDYTGSSFAYRFGTGYLHVLLGVLTLVPGVCWLDKRLLWVAWFWSRVPFR
jgi:hypothetical protein